MGTTKYAIVIVAVVAGLAAAFFYWISTKLDTTKLVNGAKVAVSCMSKLDSCNSFIDLLLTGLLVCYVDYMHVGMSELPVWPLLLSDFQVYVAYF